MTPLSESQLQEMEARVVMAFKFQSYGNLAEIARTDLPLLIAEVRRLRDALEYAHSLAITHSNCVDNIEEITELARQALGKEEK